jgi:hypothetical protein
LTALLFATTIGLQAVAEGATVFVLRSVVCVFVGLLVSWFCPIGTELVAVSFWLVGTGVEIPPMAGRLQLMIASQSANKERSFLCLFIMPSLSK